MKTKKIKQHTRVKPSPQNISLPVTPHTDSSKSGFFKRVFSYLRGTVAHLYTRPALFIFAASFLLSFVIEAFSRHSVWEAFMFIFRNPVACAFGVSIVALTLVPSLFIKRRFAFMGFMLILWLAMGVTNFIVLFFRITPFSAMDILLVPSVISIIPKYMNWFGVVLIGLLILFGLFLVALMFVKLPKSTVNIKQSLRSSAYVVGIFLLLAFTTIQSKAIDRNFTNLGAAYNDYGFTYCFSASIFSRGISRPTNYSPDAIEEADKGLTAINGYLNNEPNPNIILVQLESYFDLNYIRNVTYSANPVPVLTELKATCPNGALTVPSIGAGTANTEFEVLTGMNKEYFGIGEVPYKTILQEKACESICFNLKNSGYKTHAIHNHYGTFYGRNTVFPNLGFDTFTPVEYMSYVPTTPTGWEADAILPEHIQNALSSTSERDFIFTVSVQGHGKYPSEPIEGFTPTITLESEVYDEEYLCSLEYYTNMIHETDAMMGALIEQYSDYNEPVMIVFYGDHLPNLNLTEEMIATGQLLQTEYVIWTNYDLHVQERVLELASYQLSAYILELCGKSDGVITKVHQTYRNANMPVDYSYTLNLLQYDMLYGDDYISTIHRISYYPTSITFGVLNISVSGVTQQPNAPDQPACFAVNGSNFTPWSVVYINGKEIDTEFKNSDTLLIYDAELEKGDEITVAQVAESNYTLSSTEAYIVKTTDINH